MTPADREAALALVAAAEERRFEDWLAAWRAAHERRFGKNPAARPTMREVWDVARSEVPALCAALRAYEAALYAAEAKLDAVRALCRKLDAAATEARLSDDSHHQGWAVGYERAASELRAIVGEESHELTG